MYIVLYYTMITTTVPSRLFEACALMKHYQLVFDQKKTATVEEKQMLASGVLMATLAIPLPASMSENEKYLDLQVCPSVQFSVTSQHVSRHHICLVSYTW